MPLWVSVRSSLLRHYGFWFDEVVMDQAKGTFTNPDKMVEMIRHGFRDLTSRRAVNMPSWLAVAMSISC